MHMKFVPLVFIVLLLSSCASLNLVRHTVTPSKPITADKLALQRLAGSLKDPDSLKLRSVSTYSVDNGSRIIIGEWNAKNSFGGYVGFESFYLRHKNGYIIASHQSYSANGAISEVRYGYVMLSD